MSNLHLKSKIGLLLCAKYAVAPNFFGYCGPFENKNIVDHLKDKIADGELAQLVSEFETLFPYLQLIARDNRIDDSFDRRVVEAYWLGNRLLNNVKKSTYQAMLDEKIVIGKRLDTQKHSLIRNKISNCHFLPNHAFHVFNIFKRTGRDANIQTIETMNECRIGWGKVIQTQSSPLRSSSFEGQAKLKVRTYSLKLKANKLFLDKPLIKKINLDYHGKRFIKDFKVGDWVSFHWGMVCDKLTAAQVGNLEYYTRRAIDFYNL